MIITENRLVSFYKHNIANNKLLIYWKIIYACIKLKKKAFIEKHIEMYRWKCESK